MNHDEIKADKLVTNAENLDTRNVDETKSSKDNKTDFWAKKKVAVIIATTLMIIAVIAVGVGIWAFLDEKENQRLDSESVSLKDDLSISFGEEVRVSDFLENLNGSLVEDLQINTKELGEREVSFEYINAKNRRRKVSFTIEIKDTTEPIIYGGNVYTVYRNYAGDLTDLMLSGDDLDDNPQREIIGEYDLEKVGSYTVEYVVTDASGNTTRKAFLLNVIDPPTNGNGMSDNGDDEEETLAIADVIKEYKTDKVKIGIDVSQWQGEIDWTKVGDAGVEFAFIRIGYQVGFDGELILDPYFEKNVKAAENAGLPVGVYLYSYARNIEQAKEQAEWVAEKLANYKIELGVAFDWENWGDFNTVGMSFWTINKVAETFLDVLAEKGYQGSLYGSKNYLERIWKPENFLEKNHLTWLAQYYVEPTYKNEFWIWQMSDSGQVLGIYGNVDLDIMYLE